MTYEELISVWTLKGKIDEEKMQIEEWRLLAESITTPVITGMPQSKSQTSHVEKIALKIVEAEQKITAMNEELLTEKTKLFEAIKATDLPPILKKLLICRYVVCLPYLVIAKRLGYTRRHISNLHDTALKKLGMSD